MRHVTLRQLRTFTEVVRAGWNNFRSMLTGHELDTTAEVTNNVPANSAPATAR